MSLHASGSRESRLAATSSSFAASFPAVTWVRFPRKSFPSKRLHRGFPPMIRRHSSEVCGSRGPGKQAFRALSRSIRRIRSSPGGVISITGVLAPKAYAILCILVYTFHLILQGHFLCHASDTNIAWAPYWNRPERFAAPIPRMHPPAAGVVKERTIGQVECAITTRPM